MNAKEVLELAKKNKCVMFDLKFTDFPGVWQHISHPIWMLDEAAFEDGFGFDGSSIRGFQAIHESDMKLVPDVATAFVDPFRAEKTLVMNMSIRDPFTDEPYSRDPRNVARKAEDYLASTGIADTCFFGAEAEFYIFDSVRFETKQNAGYYHIDSSAGAWNTGAETDGDGERNRGYKVKYKGGYFPVSPVDHFADLRDEMCLRLAEVGMEVERSHHEVASGGQQEIN